MSNVQELPQLVTELVDLSKQYLQEQAVDPARKLGKTAALGVAAAILWAVGGVLLSVAVLRWIVGALEDTTMWSALGYGLGFAAVALVVGLLGWRMSRGSAQ
ncbi:MAG: phage holin family protein [Acidimicrobiia bacterium]|nr:phage holin family protein [Acidimicrobiia bacterium]